ncbi:hypothetical protein BU17DRAFT_87567 [Hysterangium stoloniferum]|nr:hypothetical protein BU17DRAFT_87567 [Hysterangium stoloniferum]
MQHEKEECEEMELLRVSEVEEAEWKVKEVEVERLRKEEGQKVKSPPDPKVTLKLNK